MKSHTIELFFSAVQHSLPRLEVVLTFLERVVGADTTAAVRGGRPVLGPRHVFDETCMLNQHINAWPLVFLLLKRIYHAQPKHKCLASCVPVFEKKHIEIIL